MGSPRRGRLSAVVEVMRTRDLRRLQLGWAAYFFVDGIAFVALGVWAFDHGGTGSVGLVSMSKLLPGALALPFGAWAADRFERRRVMSLVFLTMALTQVAIAVALASDTPALVLYVLVAFNSVAAAPYRPAHLALVPLVARSPQELVAINVAAGSLEGVVTFAGPALAALLLIGLDPWFVMAVSAAAALGGMLAVAGIQVASDPSKALRRAAEAPLAAILGGFREMRRNHDLATIVWCFITQLLVRGLLNVLLVAVSFDLIDEGKSGVGWLAAVMGIGGIVGAVLAVSLTGRRRLGMPYALALVLWGGPLAVIGLAPNAGVAFAAMLTVGLGNALLDVAGFTLMQRLGADRALGRVFGVLFSVGVVIASAGSLIAPPLIDALGLRTVLVIAGLILPTLSLVLTPKFRAIDARSEPQSDVLALLTRIPLLAPLPPTTLEKLAARATVAERDGGDVVVAEGAAADHFYAIAAGAAEVIRGGVHRATLGPGDQFGEIALLGGTTRTATVATTEPTTLVVIDGTDFVDALTSSEAAFAVGTRIADEHLARDGA